MLKHGWAWERSVFEIENFKNVPIASPVPPSEQRLRTHLRRRHKIRKRVSGYGRFSDRSLYDRYGLYKVPTTAGWTKAHASR
jgi:hypothetical protein